MQSIDITDRARGRIKALAWETIERMDGTQEAARAVRRACLH